MSDTARDAAAAGVAAEAVAVRTGADARAAGRRGRGSLVAAGLVVVLGAGAAAAWLTGALSSAAAAGSGQLPRAPATQPVVRQDLSATTPVAATLGYAGTYTVTGQGGGTLTWLPQPGQVISQGQVLYQTGNGSPVVLLYGSVPDWRTMSAGLAGADVAQLNHDLVSLKDANSADVAASGWDYYSWETVYGVQQLEEHLGASAPPGSLSLGQVVFEQGAIRVAEVTGTLGGPASGPVLTASSDLEVVTIALDVTEESEVAAGDAVTVSLPNGSTTPGVVSSVGTVATTSASASGNGTSSGDGNAAATVPVTVTLADPAAAGSLDQAPVTVNITTAAARDVLAVPVTALLAHPGGYDVEVVGPGDTRRYVPVTVGPIFDDSSGLVQVSGALTPGQRVVVASS